jgi:A/G-specific adenine glycosylase
MRGRVIVALRGHGELEFDELGPLVRVDYVPDGTYGRE